MYMLQKGIVIVDFDLNQLEELFKILNKQWTDINVEIGKCWDPESFGFYENLEYLAGLGFVACQRYITATRPSEKIMKKDRALELPPIHKNGKSYASLINATANYWKHLDEHDDNDKRWKLTIQTLKSIIDLDSYYNCINILTDIAGNDPAPFTPLLNIMTEWRTNIIEVIKK